MIGKHIPSPKNHSSFKGLNDYITGKSKRRLEDQGEKIAYSDCINLASVDTATVEMESLAFQNKRCKDPVMHLLLSWRENETPTEEQVREAVKITLDEMNLSQCQAIWFHQINAQAKAFFDRLYPFFNVEKPLMSNTSKRGKKAALVCPFWGGPADVYGRYAEETAKNFSFMGADYTRALVFGDIKEAGSILKKEKYLEDISTMAQWLSE